MKFMKMKNTLSRLFAIALVLVFAPTVAWAQQTVIVIRHAERADGGAGANTMTATPSDPPLSPLGEARAARLASMLADAGVTAIYTTEFKRTQETAGPLASKLGLKIEVVPSKDTGELIARIRRDQPKGIVVVIGHSNTVPEVVKAFTGRTVSMRDDEYTAMFVLTPLAGTATLIRW
jgi:broad specificity phosphatase PhoE